jgi:ActR/RegA family two-component response regulator
VSPAARPGIVLLGSARRPRTLIRAQLIEDGFDVVAANTWSMMRRHLRPGAKPALAIVDLQDLESPMEVLEGLRILMPPGRVLVLTALGTVAAPDIEALGFQVLARPLAIDDIVAAAARMSRDPR